MKTNTKSAPEPTQITQLNVRVPDAIKRKLKSRAALGGVTLKVFLLNVLETVAETPPGRAFTLPKGRLAETGPLLQVA